MSFREPDGRSLRFVRSPRGPQRWLREIFLEDWNLKLIALAITLGLWYGVTGQRAPITVRLRGVQLTFRLPEDMQISNDPRSEVEVTLTGNRNALNQINARDLVVYVDVTDRKPGERVVKLTAGRVKMELPEGVHLESVEPGVVPLRLEPRVERQIEVEARLEGNLPEGYELLAVNTIPAKVRVRGPASHIDTLEKASTETISLDGRRESFTLQQVAIDISDPKVDVLDSAVSVYVRVGERRTEKTLANVAVHVGSGAQARPKTASVVLYGPSSMIGSLRPEEIQIVLERAADGTPTPHLVLPPGMDGLVELRSMKPTHFSIK